MRIAVIGAGPAGLVAAKTAAENGLEVTLFERYKIGERINCGEGFFDLLGLCGKPESAVLFQVKEILLKIRTLHRIASSDLNIWMIDRFAWQHYLAEMALKAGAKVLQDTPVHIKDVPLLKRDFDWVIDASGVHCLTLRAENSDAAYKGRSAFTLQYKLQGDFSYLQNSIKAVIEPHYEGYYWIFPKVAAVHGIANVGIGVLSSGTRYLNLKNEMLRIIKQENLEEYDILSCKGGIIPLSRISPLLRGNILLVGDAAGLASTLHGGGMDVALLSGKLAALALVHGKPQHYEKKLLQQLKFKIAYEEKIYELWKRHGWGFMEATLKMALLLGGQNFRRGLFKAIRKTIKVT